MARDNAHRPGGRLREPFRRAQLERRRLVVVSPANAEAGRQEVEPEPDSALRLEVRVVDGDLDGDVVVRSSASGHRPMLLRVDEAARMLAISRAALYPLLGRDIPVVRIGRSVRIQSDALRKFIAEHVDRR